MRRRKALLIFIAVVVIYLAFIHRSAIFVLREDFRLVRAVANGSINPEWLWGEEELAETEEAAVDSMEANYATARKALSETRMFSPWDELDHQPFLSLLEEAEKADPENALINYTSAWVLLKAPGQSVWKEEALAEVEAGNGKKHLDDYFWRAKESVYEYARKQFHHPTYYAAAEAENIALDIHVLPHLRELARRAYYAAEHYLRKEEPEAALRYARVAIGLADKLYEKPSTGPIPIMAGIAIEGMWHAVGVPAALISGDQTEMDYMRGRALGGQMWMDRFRAADMGWQPGTALWPMAVLVTSDLAIFAVLCLVLAGAGWVVARGRRKNSPPYPARSLSSLVLLLLVVVLPCLAVLAYAATLVVQGWEDITMFADLATWMGVFRALWMGVFRVLSFPPLAGIWLAPIVGAAAWVGFLWLLAPVFGRREVSRQLGRRVRLAPLFNPFSGREERKALTGILRGAFLPAGLILLALLVISFLPGAWAMKRATYLQSNGNRLLVEKIGTPKPLGRDAYHAEIDRLAEELLSSEDPEAARLAGLSLERSFAYEKIPDLLEALSARKEPEIRSRIWIGLYRLAPKVPFEPLLPHLLTDEGEVNWDAARVAARSDDPQARKAMARLLEMLSSDQENPPSEAVGETDSLSRFLNAVAEAVRDEPSAEEVARFANAAAEGGHSDLAMELVRRFEATGEDLFAVVRALGYVGTEEARQLFRGYWERTGEWFYSDVWPSSWELCDEALAESVLRKRLSEKEPVRGVEVLAAFTSPRFVPLFLEGLSPEQPIETRCFSAYMLGYAGDEAVVPPLARVLSEPLPETLGEGRQDEGVSASDPEPSAAEAHWKLRTNAAYALGRIGSESARGALEKALEDENEKVREAARWALEQLDAQQ